MPPEKSEIMPVDICGLFVFRSGCSVIQRRDRQDIDEFQLVGVPGIEPESPRTITLLSAGQARTFTLYQIFVCRGTGTRTQTLTHPMRKCYPLHHAPKILVQGPALHNSHYTTLRRFWRASAHMLALPAKVLLHKI